MKPIRGFFKFMGRSAFNFRRFSDYDNLRDSASDIYQSGKQVFKKPHVERPDTFAEAVKRYNLSDKDLKERYDTCKKIFIFFGSAAALLAAYTLYLLTHGTFLGAILAGVVATLTGMHAFKYHFWMFQIKHKKLGCTLGEYQSGKINQ